jgi:hypothetical protein
LEIFDGGFVVVCGAVFLYPAPISRKISPIQKLQGEAA